MDEDFLEVTQADAITTIRINRPHVLNAIHPPLHHALQRAFDAFAADARQRVCVLTGVGERAFSVGSDLKYVAEQRAAGSSEILTRLPAQGYGGLAQRFDLTKPVIAAVNGLALGGGFELALACDLIVASDTARFGLPEVKVGGFAHAGGAARLARQIPLKRAMAMLLTGDLIDAEEGLALGLVNEIVPASELAAATRRWCEKLLAGAPKSAALTKQAVLRGLDAPSLAAAMEQQAGYAEYAAWLEADEISEGAAAFAAKRPPRWRSPSEDSQ